MSILEEKIKINNLNIEGRIVMPPVATYQAEEEGFVTDKILDYYGARAENPNVSLIITEHSYITLQGKAKSRQIGIDSDDKISGLKKLTDRIHKSDTKVFCQLNHAGSAADSDVSGMQTVGPSQVILPVKPMMGSGELPLEMKIEEVHHVVQQFAQASVRAKKARFDGVEIHCAHGYILNQFYSPLTNKRRDKYGGILENRLRFTLETIEAVRNAVGNDYPISVRLGGSDYHEGGNTIEDAIKAAKLIEAAGANMISITGGMCRYTREGHKEAGYFSDLSYAVKNVVSIPVLLTGGVTEKQQAEKLCKNESADLVGVGRSLLKNPNWEK